jgi:hypothetical protein
MDEHKHTIITQFGPVVLTLHSSVQIGVTGRLQHPKQISNGYIEFSDVMVFCEKDEWGYGGGWQPSIWEKRFTYWLNKHAFVGKGVDWDLDLAIRGAVDTFATNNTILLLEADHRNALAFYSSLKAIWDQTQAESAKAQRAYTSHAMVVGNLADRIAKEKRKANVHTSDDCGTDSA